MSFRRFSVFVAALAWLAAPSLAGTISSIVVYGDSLSDNGNLFAATGQRPAPYYQGRFSNGPVAVEQLATNLGVPSTNFVDFAWAGATTGIGNFVDSGTATSFGAFNLPGMLTEFSQSQASLGPFIGGLFVVWGGPNDFLSPSPLDASPADTINRAVTDLLTIVGGLQLLGATDILVPGMPDLGLTPFFQAQGPLAAAQGTALTDAFNGALRANLPPGVTYFDSASLLRSAVSNPGLFGFTNVTDPCFNGTTVCANPGQYLFWDDLHPTTATDAIVAGAFQTAVTPEPSTVILAAAGFGLLILARRRLVR